MAYLTQANLVALFGEPEIIQLSNLYSPAATAIDSARVTAAIAYAEDEINSYLAARYTLPINLVPLVLTNKAADIVRYQLDSLHPREDVRKRYEDAIKWLMAVAKGAVALGLADASTPTDAADEAYSVATQIPDPVFEIEEYKRSRFDGD